MDDIAEKGLPSDIINERSETNFELFRGFDYKTFPRRQFIQPYTIRSRLSQDFRAREISEGKTTKFPAVGGKDKDFLGGQEWRNYLDSKSLRHAWETPPESPYAKYQKFKTIDSIDRCKDDIRPRLSNGDDVTAQEIQKLISRGIFDEHTAVILNSGGQHSAHMAAELIDRLGYQPVVMFDSPVVEDGAVASGEELSSLLYEAARVAGSKDKIQPTAPPVFIMDLHRDNYFSFDKEKEDNSHTFKPEDLPKADELRANGITKIVYIDEADYLGVIVREDHTKNGDGVQQDLHPMIAEWQKNDIEFWKAGITPYPEKRAGKLSPHKEQALELLDNTSFGGRKTIALNHGGVRLMLSEDEGFSAVNEQGYGRGLTDDELKYFRTQIELKLEANPNDTDLRDIYSHFPLNNHV